MAEHPSPQAIEPPADVPEIQRGNWFDLPQSDPLANHLAAHYWPRAGQPARWQAGRLSGAVYIYRERASGWSAVAKFYAVKTSSSAQRHARAELELTRQAQAAGLAQKKRRAIRPLGTWRGVLLLEYVDGLTLEDVVAVRRSRPGTLLPCLGGAAALLATLHGHSAQPEIHPDYGPALRRAQKYLDTLSQHGVLVDDPLVRDGLEGILERWAGYAWMQDFTPVLVHGDATSSNFIFPWDGGVVAIDWERAHPADPAADLGRLLAEVAHSIKQHGGSMAEALPFLQHVQEAYSQALPGGWDVEALLRRARFYQASSSLRIARNGWIPPLDRVALVSQALALLGQ